MIMRCVERNSKLYSILTIALYFTQIMIDSHTVCMAHDSISPKYFRTVLVLDL